MLGKSTDKHAQQHEAKLQRQKSIRAMEKITKNLFKMFRDTTTTAMEIEKRFLFLKKKLDLLGDVFLDSPYHRAMREYIQSFEKLLKGTIAVTEQREHHMRRLNRIQKIKNNSSYKKQKYEQKHR